MRASGSLDADVVLKAEGSRQDATISANVRNLVVDTTRIGQAEIEASVADLLKVPMIDGTAHASDVARRGHRDRPAERDRHAEGKRDEFLGRRAAEEWCERRRQRRAFATGRRLPRAARHCGFEAGSVGRPTDGAVDDPGTGPGYRHRQSAARCRRRPDRRARNGCREVEPGGVHRQALPLAIANAIRPDLALGGTIDGSAAVTGTRSRARHRIRSEGAGDCCRGPSPGRPQHDRRRREGHLERPEAHRQCLCRQPRRVAGNGRRHGSARRRRAGSRRQPESVSARRAECRRAWPGAWRHDLRVRQNSRLSGAAERRTSTSAATASARPFSTILDCRHSRRPRPGAFPIRSSPCHRQMPVRRPG